MLETGKPPVSEAERYVEPFPGWFSRGRPQLADIPLPLPPHVLLFQLGRLADGCGLHALAWRRLNEAKELAGSEGLRVLQLVVDLEIAELAARREKYEEALQLSLSGIRSFGAIQRLQEQGMSFLTADLSIDELLTGLTIEQRKDAECMAYWTTIGPAITRYLARGASHEEYSEMIGKLEDIFERHKYELSDHEYWVDMLREIRSAFSLAATRETIREQIDRLPEQDLHLRVLIYLGFCRTPHATLTESCAAQSAALEALLRMVRVSKLMCEYVAIYVLKYWAEVAETQAFALRNPRGFKSGLKSLQEPTISNAVKLLLLAAEATGTRLSHSLRESLKSAAVHGD